tara:strand:- start:28 stop:240 length:213 start_codon:yes stop_codon:yes gene_type:complete
MKIRKLPDLREDEKIYGFQAVTNNYAIDLYLSFNSLNFYCNYDRDFKDLAIAFGVFMFGITNLNWRYKND